MNVAAVAERLRTEASRVNERRVLVFSGTLDATQSALEKMLSNGVIDPSAMTVVGSETSVPCEHLSHAHADRLLGATRDSVVVNCHEELRPNVIGRVVGAVDGGGLLVFMTPSFSDWPAMRDGFDATLAVPPYSIDDVGGNFKRRFVDTLQAHRGVAIIDVEADSVITDGITDPAPRILADSPDQTCPSDTSDREFPAAAYETCLTADQVAAVSTLETLRTPGKAVLVEADRGRGKSAAAGIAAASFVVEGLDVCVTAPQHRSAVELFDRARLLLSRIAPSVTVSGDPPQLLETATGRVYYRTPREAIEEASQADVVLVDEAAGLPVRVLTELLAAPAIGFLTTVHGYEGAGRGFSVRFRDKLVESDHSLERIELHEPIRYAAGDPIEVWAFRALLLNASPPPESVVEGAIPNEVEYAKLTPDSLLDDDQLLRETFGLLVLAHYRTEPDDLARLLDAPNIDVRALLFEGHVVAVALIAREGGLDAGRRAAMYEGDRIAGNMLPDVLTSQLRDENAAALTGGRIMRIATHPAVRSRGLGSLLLESLREEFSDRDWLGTGFGATPELLRFWTRNGYSPIHLSTTRNESSGEYSVLMLNPLSEAGRDLRTRHARWFLQRVGDQLSDALSDADPDIVRSVIRAVDAEPTAAPTLSDRDWRVVADTAFGPGLYATAPGAFRELALAWLHAPETTGGGTDLSTREQRLLVLKVLQGRPWREVIDVLDYPSHREGMRALGRAFRPLVTAWGSPLAHRLRDRYEK